MGASVPQVPSQILEEVCVPWSGVIPVVFNVGWEKDFLVTYTPVLSFLVGWGCISFQKSDYQTFFVLVNTTE